MKSIIFALIFLFFLLQYELWFAPGGIFSVIHVKQHITQQQRENTIAEKRNAALVAEIKDLKTSNDAVEEHARNELGMVKKDEVFYQVVKK